MCVHSFTDRPCRVHGRRAMTTNSIRTQQFVQDYARAMEHLVGVVQQLALSQSLGALVETALYEARILTGAEGATFILRDGDQSFYVSENAIAPLWAGSRFPMESCVSGWVMQQCQPAVVYDVYGDARVPVEMYRTTFVHSLAMVPIRTPKPVGAIGVYWGTTQRISDERLKLLRVLSDGAATAMESITLQMELRHNAQEQTKQLESAQREIRDLMLKDELTGMHNRRGLSVLAEQQLLLSARTGSKPWLLLASLDGLKSVNEGLGRDEADKLLVTAAKVLKKAFRGHDVVARVGDDEFAAFGLCEAVPQEFGGRLQLYIDAYNETSTDHVPLSMTACLVHGEPASHATLDDLWAWAEKDLGRKKQQRRRGSAASIGK